MVICSTTITNSLIFASVQPKTTNNSAAGIPPRKKGVVVKQKPSVAEMERAIGAGMFRDRDPRGSGEQKTFFDMLSDTPIGQPESEIEKKLREAGEWILGVTEGPSRSAGHDILLVVCLRILPVWLVFLLIASGGLKLPFSIPALDDWIM